MTNTSKPVLPIYGIYCSNDNKRRPLSKQEYIFSPIDFISQWGRSSLTANYLSEFQAFNFQGNPKVTNAISLVLNELIENTIKFSADAYKDVSITVCNYADELTIQTINSSNRRQVVKLEAFLDKYFRVDLESFFIDNIKTHHEEGAINESQLGLITLKKDYGAEIGVKIVPDLDRRLYDIYIKVVLKTDEIELL